jgi:penicillin-binding protein 1A
MYRSTGRESANSTKAKKRKPAWSWTRGLALVLFGLVLCALILGTLGTVAFYRQLTRSLPSVQALKAYNPPIVSSVYAADGSLMAEFCVERRYPLPLADMPEHLIEAFVAAEDSRFFQHPGLDIIGIGRAMLKNVRAGEIVQGGSTITQQVVKSLLLTPEKTWGRKFKEAILAYRIEHYLTKDETLYIYLNQIYLGEGAYGVEAAAQTYFGKHARDLTLAESALLAGLPQAPSRYSPLKHLDQARERLHYVLQQMVACEYISQEQAREALSQPLKFATPRRWTRKELNYFTEQVRREVEARYGYDALYKEGLQIYTTMQPAAQQAAEKALDKGIRELDKRHGYRGAVRRIPQDKWNELLQGLVARNKDLAENRILEALVTGYDAKAKTYRLDLGSAKGQLPPSGMSWAAGQKSATNFQPGDLILVKLEKRPEPPQSALWTVTLEQQPEVQGAVLAMDSQTGSVVCMVGGTNFEESQFNRAVQAIRQPGSAFKPFVYAAALDRGYTPASVLVDSPISFSGSGLHERWTPANYDNKFWGPILLRNALIHSRNVVTVKLLQAVGVRYVINYARLLGIRSQLTPTLALALGASGLSLWEMITGYSAFANQGERTEPYIIERVIDRNGRVFEQHQVQRESVISPQTAYIMTNIMQGVIEEGTGRRARKLGRPAAGKTGTSNDLKDAWFIGYTPSVLAGVWLGYDEDDHTLGSGETGGHSACPVWLYFMEDYLRDTPVETFFVPPDIVFAKVNAQGATAATDGEGKMVTAAFHKDQLPGTQKNLDETDEDPETEEADEPIAVLESGPAQRHGASKALESTDSFFKSDLF